MTFLLHHWFLIGSTIVGIAAQRMLHNMKGITFEIFIYRAQNFAVKLQQKKGGKFALFQNAGGAFITQFLMGLCFAYIMKNGEDQWKRKSALNANKK